MREWTEKSQDLDPGKNFLMELGKWVLLLGITVYLVIRDGDFLDFFNLSMGLTVLLLGGLALCFCKAAFFRLWGRTGILTEGLWLVDVPSARRALFVSAGLFAVLTLTLMYCTPGFVRVAGFVLFFLHADGALNDLWRAGRLSQLPEGTMVHLAPNRIRLFRPAEDPETKTDERFPAA